MSEYYETTHVHYIPAGCNYTKMLKMMRSMGFVEPLGVQFYKLTDKGKKYVLRTNNEAIIKQDAEIDKFVDGLK